MVRKQGLKFLCPLFQRNFTLARGYRVATPTVMNYEAQHNAQFFRQGGRGHVVCHFAGRIWLGSRGRSRGAIQDGRGDALDREAVCPELCLKWQWKVVPVYCRIVLE